MPAQPRQPMLLLYVPLLVPQYLPNPELPVRVRNLATLGIINYQFSIFNLWQRHIVSMPEAAVHKDACPVLPQHQVRVSWQIWRIQPISEPPPPQPPTHNHLRLRTLRVYRRHIRVPLLWREFIHNDSTFFSHSAYASRLLTSLPPTGTITVHKAMKTGVMAGLQ